MIRYREGKKWRYQIDETKKIILNYFKDHSDKIFYPSDIAGEFGLDLKTTVIAIDELMEEGRLEVVE